MKKSIIFCGAGMSSILIVYELIKLNKISEYNILIIDKDFSLKNDRTLCFWEEKKGNFDEILTKKWNKIGFFHQKFSKIIDISPFQYKMIRWSDLQKFIINKIKQEPYIHLISQKIIQIHQNGKEYEVKTNKQCFFSEFIFDSRLDLKEINQSKFPLIKQHFLGFLIETHHDLFDDSFATFMDFTVEQKFNTRFMYVLPVSTKKALFEYTIFSSNELNPDEYKEEIIHYLKKKNIHNYKIIKKEYGVIPMTSFPFWNRNSKTYIRIGSTGGWSKTSTGFTFSTAQKKAKILAQQFPNLILKRTLKNRKFWFYDWIFIEFLCNYNHLGNEIFYSIFKRNKIQSILRFLNEESNASEEFKIILSCKKRLFIKSLFHAWKKLVGLRI